MNLQTKVAILLLLLSFCAYADEIISYLHCGASTISTSEEAFILDGTLVSQGDADFVVSVKTIHDRKFKHVCGGVLIQYGVVVTAAHCVTEANGATERRTVMYAQRVKVELGALTLGQGQFFSVESIVIHEKFNMTDLYALNDDIALLFLKTDRAPLNHVNAACVLDSVTEQLVFQQSFVSCWVMGWESGVSSSSWLMYRRIPLLPSEKCAKKWDKLRWFKKEAMICSGTDLGAPCSGDSGGPLLCSNGNRVRLMGLISFGSQICITSAVFSRISYYFEWIGSQVLAKGFKWPLQPAPVIRETRSSRMTTNKMSFTTTSSIATTSSLATSTADYDYEHTGSKEALYPDESQRIIETCQSDGTCAHCGGRRVSFFRCDSDADCWLGERCVGSGFCCVQPRSVDQIGMDIAVIGGSQPPFIRAPTDGSMPNIDEMREISTKETTTFSSLATEQPTQHYIASAVAKFDNGTSNSNDNVVGQITFKRWGSNKLIVSGQLLGLTNRVYHTLSLHQGSTCRSVRRGLIKVARIYSDNNRATLQAQPLNYELGVFVNRLLVVKHHRSALPTSLRDSAFVNTEEQVIVDCSLIRAHNEN